GSGCCPGIRRGVDASRQGGRWRQLRPVVGKIPFAGHPFSLPHGPESRDFREAKLDEVQRAVAALPDKQRAAVLMHKYEEMEYSQTAAVLNCSESTLKSLLFRAYESLRARLAHMA